MVLKNVLKLTKIAKHSAFELWTDFTVEKNVVLQENV